MSVTAVLPYSSIYSWLLNSCMPHFPTFFFFFFLASSQTLGSYQMSYLQLLFLNNCCFSYSQQATHRAPPLKGKGGPVTLSVLFSRISAHHLLPRSTPSSFIFTSAFPSLVCLGKKKKYIVTCTSPLPLLFFFALCPLFPCKGAVLCANCILSSMLLCLHTKGSSGRFPPHCPDSCWFGSFTCVVLHMKDLIKHILRLHSKTDVRSQNIYLSSVLDKAQLSAYFRISHHSEMSS